MTDVFACNLLTAAHKKYLSFCNAWPTLYTYKDCLALIYLQWQFSTSHHVACEISSESLWKSKINDNVCHILQDIAPITCSSPPKISKSRAKTNNYLQRRSWACENTLYKDVTTPAQTLTKLRLI